MTVSEFTKGLWIQQVPFRCSRSLSYEYPSNEIVTFSMVDILFFSLCCGGEDCGRSCFFFWSSFTEQCVFRVHLTIFLIFSFIFTSDMLMTLQGTLLLRFCLSIFLLFIHNRTWVSCTWLKRAVCFQSHCCLPWKGCRCRKKLIPLAELVGKRGNQFA